MPRSIQNRLSPLDLAAKRTWLQYTDVEGLMTPKSNIFLICLEFLVGLLWIEGGQGVD